MLINDTRMDTRASRKEDTLVELLPRMDMFDLRLSSLNERHVIIIREDDEMKID